MKPIPNLDDIDAMAARGRRSVLMSVRKEALEALRDAHTECNAVSFDEVAIPAKKAIEAAERLVKFADLWNQGEDLPGSF